MKLKIFKQGTNYTPSEQTIIQYLDNNLDQIEKLNIQNLATLTHTSNATIIRLSKKMHCTGFRELKVKIIKELENNHYLNEDIDFSFPFLPVDDIETIKNSLNDLYLNSLKILRDEIDVNLLENVANLILDSCHIFMFGIGDTGITTQSFINKVNKLRIYPIFASENGEQDNIARRVSKNDLVIFTSYESYASEFQKELQIIANKDCKKSINYFLYR